MTVQSNSPQPGNWGPSKNTSSGDSSSVRDLYDTTKDLTRVVDSESPTEVAPVMESDPAPGWDAREPPDEETAIVGPREPQARAEDIQSGLRTLRATLVSQIRPEPTSWMVDGIVPAGKVTAIVGRGGEGKSTLSLRWVAEATRGTLVGDWAGTPQRVGIIAYEDDWATDIRPRLDAAGADLDMVARLDVIEDYGGIPVASDLEFPLDTKKLEDEITALGLRLVVIDPATSAMHGDPNSTKDVRAFLGPLLAVTIRTGVTVLVIHHFRKGGGTASEKTSGSHAWRDACRCLLQIVTDDQSGRRVLTVDKMNGGKTGDSYEFSIDEIQLLDAKGRPALTPRGTPWVTVKASSLTRSDMSVQDIINRTGQDSEDAEERNIAQETLVGYLYENGGEAPAKAAIRYMQAQGFSQDQAKKARSRARDPRVTTKRQGFGGDVLWKIDYGTEDGPIGAIDATVSTPQETLAPMAHMEPSDDATRPSQNTTAKDQAADVWQPALDYQGDQEC